VQAMAEPPPLDDVDRRILSLLRGDARLSARAIGREIGMSAGAVSDRIARLEANEVIRGYRADVSPAALGYAMRVIVGLQTEQGTSVEETMEALLRAPEVIEVSMVSGAWDFVVLAQVRDHDHLRELIVQGLWGAPGFRHSETMIVLERREGTQEWVTTEG
jgi:Lrp/AsnC family leucine-responsive transcriptional regulator